MCVTDSNGHPALVRLTKAINEHDLSALTHCFAEGYRNETPAHPARGFTGRAQVRANWTQILSSVPDLHATLVRCVQRDLDAETEVWAEWDWAGTRPDHGLLRMRGVTVLGGQADQITWARFYMEPVDPDLTDVGATIRGQVGAA